MESSCAVGADRNGGLCGDRTHDARFSLAYGLDADRRSTTELKVHQLSALYHIVYGVVNRSDGEEIRQ